MHTDAVEKILLAVIIIVAIALFLQPLMVRLRIVGKAKGKLNLDRLGERIMRWFREVAFQGTVIAGRPLVGWMHAFVFWAFIVFLLESTDLVARMFGSPVGILGNGAFHHGYQQLVAVFAVLALIGILYLTYRRFIERPPALGEHLSWSSGLVAVFIAILMVTYLLGVYVFEEFIRPGYPVNGAIIDFIPLTEETEARMRLGAYHRINAWVHVVTILAFLALIPRSKHLHLFLGLFTTFFKDFDLARIRPLDFEAEEVGAEKLTDLSKHSVLGAFTCVECGRCYDQCPARNTGKRLDPKQLMLDLRAALLADPSGEVLGDERFKDVIWQCTTCGACTFQCPVGIDQVVPIIEIRRGYVANSVFPDAMRPLFDNLESVGNPWLYPPTDAATFLSENNFPPYEKGKVLYWMGCMARYDAQYRDVALAFARLLNAAGVNWGVLADEQCTGDAARRAGNEFLFQALAETNIEMLNEAAPELIVTTCPHCLRMLTEYKDLGLKKEIEIMHHTRYLIGLIAVEKLKLSGRSDGRVVFHDACYLSRYGDDEDYLNPRSLVQCVGATLIEPERAKRTSFCCGAGGAMLFTEETEGTRINHDRVDELLRTGVDSVAVACPFCQMMLRDGFTDKGKEDMPVRDVAQLLAQCLGE